MPQQCPCEAWWQVLPAVLTLSPAPSAVALRGRPSHRPASACLSPRFRSGPTPQAGEWKESMAHRGLGFPAFKGYY